MKRRKLNVSSATASMLALLAAIGFFCQPAFGAAGASWTKVAESVAWSPRVNHAVLVYNNKMWVLGGWSGFNTTDVWSSSNGVSWSLVTSSAPWSAGVSVGLVYDNKMWVLGAGVWYSADGASWTKTSSGAVSATAAVVYGNKMWVFTVGDPEGSAYQASPPYYGAAYYSTDGVTWTMPAN